jgi:phage shock protein E
MPRFPKWLILVFLTGAAFCAACGEKAKETAREPVPERTDVARAQADSNLVVIDVRTKEEFDKGHIESAIHIPYEQIGDRIEEVTTDLDQPIMVYCRIGRRSGIAQETLRRLGYRNVVNGGAYEDLKRQENVERQ